MATTLVPELRNLSYEERLKEINLMTLEQREREDLIDIQIDKWNGYNR